MVGSSFGIGPAGIQRQLNESSITDLRQKLEHEPQSLSGINKSKFKLNPQRVEQALIWQDRAENNHLICFDDKFYPPLLKTIYDPPVVLFVKGSPEYLLRPSLAVVGSRSASRIGLQVTDMLAQQIAKSDVLICSGMASGIDSAAHQAALNNDKATLAVLGTGVDQCYPATNRSLMGSIINKGCIISEFWPQTKPIASNFPKRNRIISGMTLGTLVIEARNKSGSLITARLASEQGREVFAVPGGILGGQNQGCHDLLKNGAKLVENAGDIFEELYPLLEQHMEQIRQVQDFPTHSESKLPIPALLASVNYDVTSLDEVVEHSGTTIDLVLAQLLELELQGWVAAVPGGYVRLKRN